MNIPDLVEWFESLKERAERLIPFYSQYDYFPDDDTSAWFTEAETAVKSVFPPEHPVIIQWNRHAAELDSSWYVSSTKKLIGVFLASANLVRARRLGNLIDAIRAQTEGDLLDQAVSLLKSHPVAAAVIAGGALETHLRYLIAKNSLKIDGHGSIEAYNQSVARARNSGNEIYSATLSKHVTAWGGIRNDAAHDPGNFKHSVADIERMIDGIRDFIERTTST